MDTNTPIQNQPITDTNPTPPISTTPSKNNSKVYIILFSLLTIASLVTSAYFYYQNRQLKQLKTITQPQPQTTKTTPTNPIIKEKVILYRMTTGDVENQNTKIMRKIGDKEPEELLDIGKDQPSNYLLILDNNYLVLNYSDRIDVLNLITKEVKNIYTYQHGYSYRGVTVSQDNSHLIVIDQGYATDDKSFSIYKISTNDWTSSLIYQEPDSSNVPPNIRPIVWRDDDIVIIGQAMGDISDILYFDLKTNTLTRSSDEFWADTFSTSGKLLGMCKYTVDDPCNAMTGSSPGSCQIIEPVSGQQLGQIGDDSKVVSIISFSSDDKEILYSTSDLISYTYEENNPFAECPKLYEEQDKNRKYFKKNIADQDSKAVEITNIQDTLSVWDQYYDSDVVYKLKGSLEGIDNKVIGLYFQ